jgi:hypothetical protein
MPPPVFNTASELLAHILLQIAPNGNEEITGQRHQDVLVTTVNSLLNIVACLPGQTVNDFPAWSGGATYPGGVETVVKHSGKLWLFVSPTDSLGTQPGTNGLVWQEINAVQLAHFRNRDQYLDQGGPGEVSAMQLRRLLATRNAWRQAVDAIATEPVGGEPIGYVYVVDNGATGDFAGYDGNLAERISTGWQFAQIQDGDTMRFRDYPAIVMRTAGSWFIYDLDQALSVPALGAVTGVGAATNQAITQTGGPLRWLGNPGGGYAANAPGDVVVNYAGSCAVDVTVSANATMKVASHVAGSLWFMTIRAVTGGTLSWDTAYWRRLNGVTLPTNIAMGESYLLTCFSALGKEVVINAGLISTP